MRKSLAVIAAVGLVATTVVAFAGPAGAKGTPKPKSPGKPAKESKCNPKTSAKGITYSFTQFLTGGTPAAEVAYVDQGSKLESIVGQGLAAARSGGLLPANVNTIPVSLKAKCTSKTHANVTYSLVFQDKTTSTTGAPLVTESGDAILKKGTWYVTPTDVCDLFQMLVAAAPNAPKTLVSDCYTTAGLPVPPAAS
jgi:hypothetical protein